VQIEGNLIIRWQEPDAFDVRFVPARPAEGRPAESLRVRDPAALERLLRRVGLPQERIIDVLRSPYVLHSLRIRVDPRDARRAGLFETPFRRLIGRLTRFLRPASRAS
jgi:hypothetical protein